MRSRFLSTAVLAALGLSGPWARNAEACSLCQCGDPTYTLVGSQVFVPGSFRLSLDADRYEKDQVSMEDPSLREDEVENRVTLSGSYSAGSRVTLVGRVPFARRTITAGDETESLTGFSDPEVIAHMRLGSSGPNDWVSVSAGVRTAWGQNDRTLDGERAEEHLQPGTGAWGGSAGFAFSRGLQEGKGSLFGSAAGRFNGRNEANYKYGSVLLANLAYERRLVGRLNGVLEMNFRAAGKDEEAESEQDPNTGGKVLYLTPRLLLRITKDVWLRAGVQVPVWKDLYGDQDEKVNVLAGLTFKL